MALERLANQLERFGDRLIAPRAALTNQWRLLAWKWLGAGAVTLLAKAFGSGQAFDHGLIALLGMGAVVLGLVLLVCAPRLGASFLVVPMLAGIAAIGAGIQATGTAHSPFILFYAWIVAEAFFILSQPAAAGVTLLAAAGSGASMYLAGRGEGDVFSWWLMVVSTLIATGCLAGMLRIRSDRLIAQLARAATHDELTGLLNRRGYQERLAAELSRSQREQTPLSIVLGDIDGFKALNDSYGHRCGDEALRDFADVCRRETRGSDFVSRVGGEEFAIVLPGLDEHEALATAERLRRAVRAGLRRPDGSPLTASFGVATSTGQAADPELMLDDADRAMYEAKALGRDRTVAFDRGLRAVAEPVATPAADSLEAVLLLAETLDIRDAATRAHSDTVARLCEQTARALGMPAPQVERIRLAGLLHDVGKIGVPDDVLRKEGRLSDCEWAEMRKHPEVGARIVAATRLDDVAQWVLAHHERPDGHGYPRGLTGDEIPVEARILAVADAFEAMTADRPYRKAPGPAHAVIELERGAGTQFDVDVVRAFLSTLPQAVAA